LEGRDEPSIPAPRAVVQRIAWRQHRAQRWSTCIREYRGGVWRGVM
jgi:hypothetical protein